MKMLVLLLLIPLVSAQCTQITTTLLANSTMTLDFDECLNITDIGSVIYIEDIKQNEIINMTPYATRTNTYTNSIYNCNYDNLNQNRTMSFGESYNNPNHNLYLSCPEFPKINSVLNLTAGNSYAYSEYNLTINALYKNWGINSTLQHSGSYINEESGIAVYAPPFPIKNETISVDTCDYYKRYNDIELTITSPDCINKEITLGNGESYEVDFFNLKLNAPIPLDNSIHLVSGESWLWNEMNVSVDCTTTFDQYDNFCKNRTAEFVITTWSLINITNFSCTNYGVFCIDNLTQNCNYGERVGDKLGMIKCWNRNIDDMKNKTLDYQVKYDQCNSERTNAQGNENTTNQALENIIMMNWQWFAIMILIVAVAFGAYAWAKSRRKEIK